MSQSLDLQIENYTVSDLVTFFRLSVPYQSNDILQKESEIRNLLLSSGHIQKHMKRDLIVFLENAKHILIDSIPPPKQPLPKEQYPKYIPPPSRQENIISPAPTSFVYTQPSDFFPGQLNPLNTRTLKKCISIDTRFRPQNSSSSDFLLSLPNKVVQVLSMECNSFELCPFSVPNISSSLGNNFLYISVQTNEKEYTHIFILPNGYYTTSRLIELLNQMFSEQKNTPFLFLEWLLDPYESGKCILMMDLNQDPKFSHQILSVTLDFSVDNQGNPDKNNPATKIGRLLGFVKSHYSGKKQYMGETIPNPNIALSSIYLCLDDFQNRSISSFQPAFAQMTMAPSILARISLLFPEKLEYLSIPRKYFGPIDLSRFHVRLVDMYGRTLEMDQADYSFCLLLDTVYDL
jgi:hypothetical protein